MNIEKQLARFGQRALSFPVTVINSYILAKKCIDKGIEGDFVECGVFAGTQIAAMALANQNSGMKKKIHLFDSFIGIPQAGPNDDETITSCIGKGGGKGSLATTGISVCSVKAVQGHMREWGINSNQLLYHIGWFQDVVPLAAKKIKKIAILRLDGDLYESTKVCLNYLHPLVPKNGYVIIDDYALTGCRKAVDEYHLQIGINPKIITIEGGGGPVWYKIN